MNGRIALRQTAGPSDAGKTIGAYHSASVGLELGMAWASLGQGLTRLHLGHRAGASLVDAMKTWEGTSAHQTFLLSLVPWSQNLEWHSY